MGETVNAYLWAEEEYPVISILTKPKGKLREIPQNLFDRYVVVQKEYEDIQSQLIDIWDRD